VAVVTFILFYIAHPRDLLHRRSWRKIAISLIFPDTLNVFLLQSFQVSQNAKGKRKDGRFRPSLSSCLKADG